MFIFSTARMKQNRENFKNTIRENVIEIKNVFIVCEVIDSLE